MAGNREIHGEVTLDVKVEGEETARDKVREAFANLDAHVNVSADFDRGQVQAALDKVAGKGIKVAVNAAFTLTQMRAAAKAAASKGNGIHVNVNAKFSRAQIQKELLASSAGVKIPVLVQAIQDGTGTTGGKGISEKLAREYRLAAQAAASDPGAAQAVARGVNQRIGAFQAASLRMKEITAKSEADRVKLHEKANLAIAADDRAAMRDSERRLDKLADERQKDAQQILKDHTATENKLRVETKKTAELEKRLQAEVNAGRDKFDDGVRAQAEKENQKRLTRQFNNESDAAKSVVTLQERGDQQRLTSRERTLGKIEVREDASAKRIFEITSASSLRREVIDAQFRARTEAADRAFAQRRILAAERAARAVGSNKPIVQEILVRTDKASAALGEFDRFTSRFLKTSLLAFGLYSAGVVAALAAIGIAAEVDFAKFEAASRRAAATAASSSISDEMARNGKAVHTFSELAQADLAKIEARAKQVSLQTVGISATDAATGIQTLVQAGQSLPSALTNISAAAKFAQVNGDDLTTTTENLAAAMTAAGINSKDTVKFLDQVQLSSQNAIGGAGDFLEALANGAASAARTFGQTNSEAQVLVQLLANTGITGREAGTQGSIVFREFNKVIGQSAEQLKEANVDTTTFGSSVVGIAQAFDDAKKSGKNVFAFGKDLGFTQKSIRSILAIIPQLQELGPAGFTKNLKQLANAKDIVQQQVDFQRKGVAAQFDNLKDTVGNLSKEFGNAAAGPVSKFLDLFAGENGKLTDATKTIQVFGHEFGLIVAQATEFAQSDNFTNGVQTLVESIKITVGGVADTMQAFSSAFNDTGEAQSTFESFADTVLAFSKLSADILPRVAKIIGEIVNFLIDHADAFEAFAKVGFAIFAANKAYKLFLKPLGTGILLLTELNGLILGTGEAGALAGVARAAAAYGLLGNNAKVAAAEAVAVNNAVDVAQSSVFLTSPLGGKGRLRAPGKGAAGVAAKGTTGNGGLIAATAADVALQFGQHTKLGRAGTAGADAARAATTVEAVAPAVTKSSRAFELLSQVSGRVFGPLGKVFSVLGRFVPVAIKASPAVARIASGFAKFAGPVGFVVLAIEAVVGAVRGFIDEIHKGGKEGEDLKNSMKELEPIFNAIWESLKFGGGLILDILGVVGRLGASIGKLLGAVFNDFITNAGDAVRGIKLLFNGDLIGAIKAFGDVFVNTFTLPFRLAISAVIDLIGDVVGSLTRLDKLLPGSPIRDVADALDGAAGKARDFRLNMSEATGATEETKKKVQELDGATQAAANTTAGLAYQHRIVANIASLSEEASRRAAVAARGSVVDITSIAHAEATADTGMRGLLSTVNTFHPTFAGVADAGVNAMGQITTVAQSTTSQLLAMQAAIQAGLGQTQNAVESTIQAGLVQQLANAQAGKGALSVQQAKNQFAANTERLRQEALIRNARKAQRDAGIIQDALGSSVTTGGGATPAAAPAAAASPVQRAFVDPDEAIQAAIDRLKPSQKIAQVNALVSKFSDEAVAKTSRVRDVTNKFTSDAQRGYQLTRRDTLLLAEAMPQLDAALEAQKTKVQKLEEALSSLQQIQLKGSKAFSDAAFENEQAIKKLQLARLDLLAAGNTDGSAPVLAIDKQIEDLQKQAERASLVESITLDPQRRQLEQAFNPVKEDTFDNIIAQFKKITAAQQTQTDKLTAQEETQTRLNAALEAAQSKYEKIDAAAAKSVESFNAAQQASAGTASSISSVGRSATAGATAVDKYATAVENVPSGKGVVDKSLKGITDRVKVLTPQFQGAGDAIMLAFLQGINRTWANRVQPALVAITNSIPLLLDNARPGAVTSGQIVMGGFLDGLKDKFGTKKQVGSIAWYLGTFIPQWIIDNKGPVSYDAQILVPAGQAVMDGFGKGLRDGFGEITGFVKGIGPSISEYVTTDGFSDVTAQIMADIAVGKTPDIDGLMNELVPDVFSVGAYGAEDPTLGFLHATSSVLDTLRMAQRLASTFNVPNPNITTTNHDKFSSSGNVSDHFYGTAADIASAGVQTPTPEKQAIFDALTPLVGSVIKQLIYKHTSIRSDSGKSTWGPSDHMNHVHAA